MDMTYYRAEVRIVSSPKSLTCNVLWRTNGLKLNITM